MKALLQQIVESPSRGGMFRIAAVNGDMAESMKLHVSKMKSTATTIESEIASDEHALHAYQEAKDAARKSLEDILAC
jgi:hypothetical protein